MRMTSKRLAEIRKEAYNVAFGYDGSVDPPVGTDGFLEIYDSKKAIEQFMEQPIQVFPYDKPVKKAKEIALDAAAKIIIAYFEIKGKYSVGTQEKPSEVVALAKEIYQWLTEPETDKP